jgi:hypothetical protein
VRRGEVWLVEVGRESRPGVVLTRDAVLDVRANVTVTEVTTQALLRRELSTVSVCYRPHSGGQRCSGPMTAGAWAGTHPDAGSRIVRCSPTSADSEGLRHP